MKGCEDQRKCSSKHLTHDAVHHHLLDEFNLHSARNAAVIYVALLSQQFITFTCMTPCRVSAQVKTCNSQCSHPMSNYPRPWASFSRRHTAPPIALQAYYWSHDMNGTIISEKVGAETNNRLVQLIGSMTAANWERRNLVHGSDPHFCLKWLNIEQLIFCRSLF
jgi:hypothetical protein